MRQLYVTYQTELVGTLHIDAEQRYQFTYATDWLGKATHFALSCSLTLQQAAFDHRLSYAFFSNLIPEGDLRHQIARVLGISDRNDFALLEAIGGEVAGAISLSPNLPSPHHPSNSQKNLSEQDLAIILQKIEKPPFLVNETDIRLSLAGAQNKLPIIYRQQQFALPLGNTASTHILKPDPERANLPQLAINEAFCMQLAQACGLNVAPVTLIRIGDRNCVLIERYDRQQQQRLHQEDFCQAMGIVPANKYQNEGGPSFADCANLIQQHSSRPAADKKRLLQWTLFNYLIGNADAHGKNIYFLQQPERVLSPFYDLLSTAIYPELNQRMSMKIGGENRAKWGMQRHWEKHCEETQTPYKMLRREAGNLLILLEQEASKLAQTPDFVSYPTTTQLIINMINRHSRWLKHRFLLEST